MGMLIPEGAISCACHAEKKQERRGKKISMLDHPWAKEKTGCEERERRDMGEVEMKGMET